MNPSITLASAIATLRTNAIVQVRRIRYVMNDAIFISNGPLELTMTNGEALLFEPGEDGQTLRIRLQPWSDVFAEPLSDENRRFVQQHGKWTAFDVSGTPPTKDLIGRETRDVVTRTGRTGTLTGMTLVVGEVSLSIDVEADSLEVNVASVTSGPPSTSPSPTT